MSEAASTLEISVPAISKRIRKLERELGVRLLNRTTRRISLTEEGVRFYDRCAPLLRALQEASAELSEDTVSPRGIVRVTSTSGFGRQCIVPLLSAFLSHYPEIEVDLSLDDAFADLVSGRIDVAIRNGRLHDSNIVARKIAPMRLYVCASPGYFARHPPPRSLQDLASHDCIRFRLSESGKVFNWEFAQGNRLVTWPVEGRLTLSSAEAVCFSA